MALDSLLFNSLTSATDSISSHVRAVNAQWLEPSSIQEGVTQLIDMGLSLASKLLIAILIYFCGRWLIRRLKVLLVALLDRHKADASLRSFLQSLVSILLNIVLIIMVISVLGINVSSILALFGAAGVAIGLALSDTLQNFANGVIILLLKPFKVGDFISVQGETGTVTAIQITTTELLTNDHRMVLIPNGMLLSGMIQNFNRKGTRRVDMSFSIAYGDDVEKAREVLQAIFREDQRILSEPEPFVEIGKLADSAVELTVRVFVLSQDYWAVYYALNDKVYKKFPANGLSFPFPQVDVHMAR